MSDEADKSRWKEKPRLSTYAAYSILVCLICLGIFWRFQGHDWDEGASLHPDEYGLANTISQLTLPASIDRYFNTRLSPLSPYQKYDSTGQIIAPGPDNRMRWGQWPIILIRWTAEKTGHTDYRDLIRIGRLLSALADSMALLILFLIGRRLYGHGISLLATALSSLAVMQIQQSHFMTVDNWAVLFAMAAVYCTVRAAQNAGGAWEQTWRWHAAFGLATGMAAATRINLLPVFGLIVFASSSTWPQVRRDLRAGSFQAPARLVLLVAIAAATALAAFRVTQPMSFRSETGETWAWTFHLNPDWVESIRVASAESNLEAGGPPAEQWTGRHRLLFPLINMIFWGMGVPLGLAALIGTLFALRRTLAGEEWKTHLLPLTWTVGYFLFMGTRRVMAMRYFLPIYPLLALMAAWLLAEMWRKSAGSENLTAMRGNLPRQWPVCRIMAGAAVMMVLGGTLLWAWGFTRIYRSPNTRIEASRWIYANLPAPLNLHLTTESGSFTERFSFAGVASGTPVRVPIPMRTRGTATSVSLRVVRDPLGDVETSIRWVLSEDPEGMRSLAQVISVLNFSTGGPGPLSHSVPIGPVSLEAGRTYYLSIAVVAGDPIRAAGVTVANESWDESLPVRLDGYDPFGGLYRGLTMEMRWPDNESKRKMLIENLALADFVILPSQRALWSVSRMPGSYPMTMEYYRALFDGKLGFDLAAGFSKLIEIGPLRISDLTGRAGWNRILPVPESRKNPFNDSLLGAEEAFSVYDHAPVWIFRKGPDFRLDKARTLLEAVDLGSVITQNPKQATVAPTALMLPPERLQEQLSGGTWSSMFDAGAPLNRRPILAVLAWAGSLLMLGWLAFPLTWLGLAGLPDRGYPMAKILALLFLAWATWLVGSLRILPFTRSTILLAVLGLAVMSVLVLFRHGAQVWTYFRQNRAYVLTVEILFLLLFGFDLLIRLGNPDLWHPSFGGEKPMVFSYFNAVLKSTSFPPYDPWLAGGYMNYYYFGFVVSAQLVKLLGIVPSSAYNLLVPTMFALFGTGVFCIAYNLVRARNEELCASGVQIPEADHGSAIVCGGEKKAAVYHGALAAREGKPANPYFAGLASVTMVLILGNLGQVKVIAGALQRAVNQGFPLGLGNLYWDATRIIAASTGGNEINEFPFFTFLYGDLHAHMLGMPVLTLVLAWALAFLFGRRKEHHWPATLPIWITGSLALGATRVINMWDFPTSFALCGAGVIAAQGWFEPCITRAGFKKLARYLTILFGLAFLLYSPFDQWFASPLTSLEPWRGVKTPLEPYLFSHGFFLFIVLTMLICATVRWLKETPASVVLETAQWRKPLVLGISAFVICAGALLALGVEIAVIALPISSWCGLLLLRSRTKLGLAERIVVFLPGMALLLTLFVELFAVGGDRMNTLFKFYLQVWLLFSLAAGPALALMWIERQSWSPGWRRCWTAVFCLLAAAAALYPGTAIFAKIQDRFPPIVGAGGKGYPADCEPIPGVPTPALPVHGHSTSGQQHGLDGMAYMQWSACCDNGHAVPLAYDFEAIRWMQANIAGSPVVVEAQSPNLYHLSSRYAWNTGLPDVVGWEWHQRQQRAATDTRFITERGRELTRFYTRGDIEEALVFLRKYQVSYIVVGPLEKAYYLSSGGLDKFERMTVQGLLRMVYRNPGVSVYQVVGPAPPPPSFMHADSVQ